jgi:DNA-binding transcriptional ArsR family regulator
MLVSQDLNVSDIAKKSNLSLASVSKHLQVLNNCGLIIKKKKGRERICQINLNRISEASIWLSSIGLLDLLDVERLESFLAEETLI